jgi:hypothetical protein
VSLASAIGGFRRRQSSGKSNHDKENIRHRRPFDLALKEGHGRDEQDEREQQRCRAVPAKARGLGAENPDNGGSKNQYYRSDI